MYNVIDDFIYLEGLKPCIGMKVNNYDENNDFFTEILDLL